MNDPNEKIWFPAKRYGWGWGLPCAWQGWVVMVLWIAIMTAGAILLAGSARWIEFAAFEVLMIAMLIAICLWKGEKPRWRWGD